MSKDDLGSHSRISAEADEECMLCDLVSKSRVFQYIPGHKHSSKSFTNITTNVLHSVNADGYMRWLQAQKAKLQAELQYHKTLKE